MTTNKPNPENLSREEILKKIDYLENNILTCLFRSGPANCVNREKRVKLLKSYL